MIDSLAGVIPALVTPFNDEDEIDKAATVGLVNHLIESGVHGIMTTGGTGEFPSLTRDERRRLNALVVEAAAGRTPVIAGTAACSTAETISLSRDAAAEGAAAIIVTAPFYFPLPDRSLLDHYRAVADAVEIPLVAYNNPLYTGNSLSPYIIAELAEADAIIGLKQSESDFGQLVEVINLVGDRISVLTGIDSQFLAALSVGASGIFSTAACVIPRKIVELYDLVHTGHLKQARSLHARLQPLNRFFEYDPGYVAPCKEALALIGFPCGEARAPLPELSPDQRIELRLALERLELVGIDDNA